MFQKTNNVYQFKYLITSLTGQGIPEVYLPELPDSDKILFKEEKKWVRPEPPEYLKKAMKEMVFERGKKNNKGELANPAWNHPKYQLKINEWEDQEWERSTKGVFFYNGHSDDKDKEPEIVYLTPFYYWYLTSWKPYFGPPDFRDSDKEVFYLLQFCEEDPNSFGLALNTIRRWGKSSMMGAWIVYRTTMNYNHNSGMQGETDEKIKKFYRKSVLKPFYKLPYYFQPNYNTDTKQTNAIEFDLPPQRSQTRNSLEEVEALESMIDYRSADELQYDGDILHSYLMEEPGKTKKVSIYNNSGEGRWDICKPCFLQGEEIIGKAFLGTTVENLVITDKGGKAYKELAYDSDYNQKQADGRTISGLYFAFLPGDCAYKGFFDPNGRPMRIEARKSLLRTRDSYKNNSRKLAGWIRKYPLTVVEIFYVSPDRCAWNAQILQDRQRELETSPEPLTSRIDLYWEGGVRFGKVKWRHNPTGGFIETSWIPTDWEKEANQVNKKLLGGVYVYSPMNDSKFASGIDPIQHRSGNVTRESKPVQYVKTKYDSSIDGELSQEILEKRAEEKFPYKTNKYFLRMAVRPNDPNVLYERVLMICWALGVSVHVEKQFGGGLISYFFEHNCSDFILYKYRPEFEKPDKTPQEGTAANVSLTEEYFDCIATYVEYFGHTLVHKEQIEDLLIADASEMTEHDDTVATGFTELACKMKPKTQVVKPINLNEYFPSYDAYGEVTNRLN